MLGGFTPFGPKAIEIGASNNMFEGTSIGHGYSAMPPQQIVEMANSGRIILPKNLNPITRDLVKRILVADPEVRLDIKDIMKHKFFEGVDWASVERRELQPPFIPRSDFEDVATNLLLSPSLKQRKSSKTRNKSGDTVS